MIGQYFSHAQSRHSFFRVEHIASAQQSCARGERPPLTVGIAGSYYPTHAEELPGRWRISSARQRHCDSRCKRLCRPPLASSRQGLTSNEQHDSRSHRSSISWACWRLRRKACPSRDGHRAPPIRMKEHLQFGIKACASGSPHKLELSSNQTVPGVFNNGARPCGRI
jgi:hypothetical protein